MISTNEFKTNVTVTIDHRWRRMAGCRIPACKTGQRRSFCTC